MKRCTWFSLASLLVLLSASGAFAQTVKTVRVVLPQQADAVLRNIAGVLARQVAQRCDASVVTDGEAPLKVELAIAPGIGTEGFRIEDRPGGGVKIVGNDARGLLYGVGKLLRTSRYDRGGFTAGAWRGTSIPEKPVRGIYFATHFHNFYHDAPIDEVQRYVEDVGLWGLNTLIVWYDMHHFKGFDSPEAVDFRKRLKAICGAARRVGLDVGFACVANEGYANSPEAIRADVKGMRGAAFPTDICTAKPEGRRYVLDNFARLYDWAADLEPKWVMIWPYDSGGCGCGQCQPWGHGGYLRMRRAAGEAGAAQVPRREGDALDVVLQRRGVGRPGAGVRHPARLGRLPLGRTGLLARHSQLAPGTSLAGETSAGRLSRDQHGRLAGVGRIRGQPAPHPLRARVEGTQSPVAGRLPVLRRHL